MGGLTGLHPKRLIAPSWPFWREPHEDVKKGSVTFRVRGSFVRVCEWHCLTYFLR
ncbi:hypothetical protein LI328DRAFT_135121 [Trichoderma asperelloides]|nr:hypothetical protein LI328DRAFT_135121 [Trichoderma asperelloides]